MRVFVPFCLRNGDLDPWTTVGVEVPTTAAKQFSLWTRSRHDAFDATMTIFHQQCFDMQLDVGRHIGQCSCVECCVKLREFAHACVCVSCSPQVMRAISSRSTPLVVGGAFARDGPHGPVSCCKTCRFRDCSCSVRLFPPCCLQHGGFGPHR